MKDSERPVVAILGAGAVGLSLAGKLAGAARVYVACRPVHADAIRDRGLLMEGIWGDGAVEGITCIAGPEEAPPSVDYVFITAKGTGTGDLCRAFAELLRGRPVVTLQNGIGNEEVISRYAGTVIGGTVTTNFSVEGPGHVRVKSQSGPMMLGAWSGGDENSLDRLIAIVRGAGIPVGKSPDIRAGKWEKSLLNISVNPLCALFSVPVGATADERLREIIAHLIRETFAVMEAEGVRVPWATADDYLAHLFGVQIPDFAVVYPSMYYDIRNGRKTEIDLLNGYVADLGERRNIPTPYNRCIADLVRFKESAGGSRP